MYDVTKYSRDHPGGAEALIEVAGTDATSAYEDVGHSEDAREIMHPFLVGVTEAAEKAKATPKPTVHVVQRGGEKAQPQPSRNFPVWGQFAAFGAIAITIVGIMWKTLPHKLHLPGGFTAGFLWASAASAVLAWTGYRSLSDAMAFGGDYTRFPPHLHSPDTVKSVGRPAGVLKPQVCSYLRTPLQ